MLPDGDTPLVLSKPKYFRNRSRLIVRSVVLLFGCAILFFRSFVCVVTDFFLITFSHCSHKRGSARALTHTNTQTQTHSHTRARAHTHRRPFYPRTNRQFFVYPTRLTRPSHVRRQVGARPSSFHFGGYMSTGLRLLREILES